MKRGGLCTSMSSCTPLPQLKMHRRELKCGTSEAPSSLLPSDIEIPEGSSWQGIFVDSKDLQTTSLRDAWQGWQPLLKWQLRPWTPYAEISAPQPEHLWGWHKGIPRREQTATRTSSSLRRKPLAAMGKALSEAPDTEHDLQLYFSDECNWIRYRTDEQPSWYPRIKNFSDSVKQLEGVQNFLEEKGHECSYKY